MLRRPHALMTASLISISGITRLSSMSMHPYLSDKGMSTHAVSSVSVSRIANGASPVVKTIIYRWVKEGLVAKIGSNL